jgi:ribosomal protein L19E
MSALYKREVIIVVHSCGAGTTGGARAAREPQERYWMHDVA